MTLNFFDYCKSDAFQSYGVCKPVWDAVQLKWVFEANLGDCGLLLGSEGKIAKFIPIKNY